MCDHRGVALSTADLSNDHVEAATAGHLLNRGSLLLLRSGILRIDAKLTFGVGAPHEDLSVFGLRRSLSFRVLLLWNTLLRLVQSLVLLIVGCGWLLAIFCGSLSVAFRSVSL